MNCEICYNNSSPGIVSICGDSRHQICLKCYHQIQNQNKSFYTISVSCPYCKKISRFQKRKYPFKRIFQNFLEGRISDLLEISIFFHEEISHKEIQNRQDDPQLQIFYEDFTEGRYLYNFNSTPNSPTKKKNRSYYSQSSPDRFYH